MKKPLPIIVIGGIALVAIGGWLYFQRSKATTPTKELLPPPIEESQKPAEQEEKSFTGKLKDALTLGGSIKCTWKASDNNFGTAYIKGDKVYTDMTAEGQRRHSIMVENCVYSWEEGSKEGFKLCFEPEEGEEEPETPSVEEFVGEAPGINYQCTKTVVSDSKFAPPEGINFLSPQELMAPEATSP
jgi:hypothetical protein